MGHLGIFLILYVCGLLGIHNRQRPHAHVATIICVRAWVGVCSMYDIWHCVLALADSRYPKLKLIDQEVPRKYKTLQEFIFVEASSMKRHKQPPIVKFIDLQKFVFSKYLLNLSIRLIYVC